LTFDDLYDMGLKKKDEKVELNPSDYRPYKFIFISKNGNDASGEEYYCCAQCGIERIQERKR